MALHLCSRRHLTLRRFLTSGPPDPRALLTQTPSRIADAVNRKLLDSGISLLQDLSSAAFAAERATFEGQQQPRTDHASPDALARSEWRGRPCSAEEVAKAIEESAEVKPFAMVAAELVELRSGMARVVESGLVSRIAARRRPYRSARGSNAARGADDLVDAAAYLSRQDGGKLFRPTLVMLMASATNAHEAAAAAAAARGDEPLPSTAPPNPNLAQRRLAEITELIHTASLLHDDILDEAATRRGAPSMNAKFDGLTAVLLGDILLARSSVALARLRSPPVVELLSSVLEQLVEGELMQAKEQSDAAPQLKLKLPSPVGKLFSWFSGSSSSDGSSDQAGGADGADRNTRELEAMFTRYIRKSYLKTGSLIAHSLRAATMLSCGTARDGSGAAAAGEETGGEAAGARAAQIGVDWARVAASTQSSEVDALALPHNDNVEDAGLADAAFSYGKHLGLAFQLVDDALDWEIDATALGKPAMADAAAGLTTAPVLFAASKFPRVHVLIARRFSQSGDVEEAHRCINESNAVKLTRDAAQEHCNVSVCSVWVLCVVYYGEKLTGTTSFSLTQILSLSLAASGGEHTELPPLPEPRCARAHGAAGRVAAKVNTTHRTWAVYYQYLSTR